MKSLLVPSFLALGLPVLGAAPFLAYPGYGGGGAAASGAVTSANMPDPYVPVDGTMNVTGAVTASGHFSASAADFRIDTSRGVVHAASGDRILTAGDGSNPVRVMGNFTDGASAVAVRIESKNDLTTSGAKIASFGDNAGVSYSEKLYIDKDGAVADPDGTMNVTGAIEATGRGYFRSGSTGVLIGNAASQIEWASGDGSRILFGSNPGTAVGGGTSDGASAVAVRIQAHQDLTTSGAKIASFGDNAGVSYAEKAYVNLDGKFVTTNPGGYYLGDLNWGAKYDTSDNNLEFRASAGAGRYFSFEGGGGGDGSANRRFAISVDDGTVVMTPVAVSITGAYTALPAGAIVQATLTGAQTWTITESGAINGQTHTICNIDTTPDVLTMDHVAGQVLLNGAADVALGQNDCLTVYYSTAASAWIQSGATSNN